MHRLAPILALLLLLTLTAAAAPTHARTTDAIRVVTSEARLDFPAAITFSLDVEAPAADLASVRLLYGPTRGEAFTIVDLAVPPTHRATVEHRLDTQVYYFPPGTAITYAWEVADAAGNLLTTPPQELVYHDTRFRWSERSERNVTVLWYEGGEAFGDELMAVTIDALDRLEALLGARLDDPVRIYVYASSRDMRGALQPNSVDWLGGAAWTSVGVIVGAIAPGDSAEVERLIPHELSHQLLDQATANPYGGPPLWLDEGLAVHAQAQRDLGWDELIEEAAEEGRLIPLEALAASFPADTDQALLSYAQSREIVEFIIETYGEAKLRDLVAAFADAAPVDEAVTGALGLSVDELDAAWRATLPPQIREAPAQSGPQTAPPDRFSDDGGPVPQPAGQQQPGQSAWLAWAEDLPPWATLGGAAVCCLALATLAGAVLLVALRLIGVDKRTM